MYLRRTKMLGFSLIELMVVVAVIAILAAFATPTYRDYVLRAARTDAKNSLVDLAARQERFRFANNAYATTLTQLNAGSTSLDGKYSLTMAGSATTFSITATPAGTQVQDKCGALTLNQAGVRGTVNSNGLSAQECWR